MLYNILANIDKQPAEILIKLHQYMIQRNLPYISINVNDKILIITLGIVEKYIIQRPVDELDWFNILYIFDYIYDSELGLNILINLIEHDDIDNLRELLISCINEKYIVSMLPKLAVEYGATKILSLLIYGYSLDLYIITNLLYTHNNIHLHTCQWAREHNCPVDAVITACAKMDYVDEIYEHHYDYIYNHQLLTSIKPNGELHKSLRRSSSSGILIDGIFYESIDDVLVF